MLTVADTGFEVRSNALSKNNFRVTQLLYDGLLVRRNRENTRKTTDWEVRHTNTQPQFLALTEH